MSRISVIYHPVYGRGEVTATEAKGFYLHVQFSDGRKRKIRRDHVEFEENAAAVSELHIPASHTRSGNKRQPNDARRIIEALRMGIVPDTEMSQFTFGREREINSLKSWLEEHTDNARFIVGSYGSGKTHLLNYLRTMAIQEGYAVALVEIDGQETPFSRPKRIYRQIVQNLQVPILKKQNRQGFRNFLRRIRRVGLLEDHSYFKHIRGENNNIWYWIEACEDVPRPPDYQYLPALYNYGTAANIYCYLLSGLGWACTRPQIGLKGLLLIFDEAETLFTRATYASERSSYNFLEALIAVANNRDGMTNNPKKTDYTFTNHAKEIPFQYRRPSGLKIALAFTDVSDLRRSSTLSDIEAIDLEPLDDGIFTSVFKEICQLYCEAYSFSIPDPNFLDRYYDMVMKKAQTTRHKIKGFVEALDAMRLALIPSQKHYD